ncbi:MAG: multicopper oxidase domain-containing protein [Saprospirales bacterium]|nr:multicopper oxidase domain-containing protein [Saprospirales bacterium]
MEQVEFRARKVVWNIPDGAPSVLHTEVMAQRLKCGEEGWWWYRHKRQCEARNKYENYGDANLPYMFHCHILSHEDGGMMGQFIVNPLESSTNESLRQGLLLPIPGRAVSL